MSVDTVDNALGNTSSSALPKGKQCRSWCFTMFEPKVDKVDGFYEALKKEAKRFCFQVERTPTTNTLHYQGFLEFKNARLMGGVVNILKPWGGKAPHVEKANGSAEQNLKYCTKADTREMGPWEYGFPPR